MVEPSTVSTKQLLLGAPTRDCVLALCTVKIWQSACSSHYCAECSRTGVAWRGSGSLQAPSNPFAAQSKEQSPLMLKLRLFLTLGALAYAQRSIPAQVTTTIFHPARRSAPEEIKRQSDSLRRADSVAMAASLSSMHRWVDSAAGSLGVNNGHHNDDTAAVETNVPTSRVDSLHAGSSQQFGTHDSRLSRRINHRTTEFRDGATAPATATSLPLILVCGAVFFMLGLSILLNAPARLARRLQKTRD